MKLILQKHYFNYFYYNIRILLKNNLIKYKKKKIVFLKQYYRISIKL